MKPSEFMRSPVQIKYTVNFKLQKEKIYILINHLHESILPSIFCTFCIIFTCLNSSYLNVILLPWNAYKFECIHSGARTVVVALCSFWVHASIFVTQRQQAQSRCFRSLFWDHGFPARSYWDITEKIVSLLHTPPPAHPSSFAPSIWNSHLPTITTSTICDNGKRFLLSSTLSECCSSDISATWGKHEDWLKNCPQIHQPTYSCVRQVLY